MVCHDLQSLTLHIPNVNITKGGIGPNLLRSDLYLGLLRCGHDPKWYIYSHVLANENTYRLTVRMDEWIGILATSGLY